MKVNESNAFCVQEDLLFHQLDVEDSSSVASLAEFVKTQFGRLDILVLLENYKLSYFFILFT